MSIKLNVEVFKINFLNNGFYLCSDSMQSSGEYLIECGSFQEADDLNIKLAKGEIPSPLKDKDRYEKVVDSFTKSPIYRLKK